MNNINLLSAKFLIITFLFFITNSYSQYGIEWERNYGGTSSDSPRDIINTSDNGFLMIGIIESDDINISNYYGLWDLWVVKTDNSGNIEWEKNYGGTGFDQGLRAIETSDGGFLLGGSTHSSDIDVSNVYSNGDYWIIKTDALGNIQWEENFGGSLQDQLSSIIELADGNYVLFGSSQSSDFDVTNTFSGLYSLDYWIVKISTTGSIIWEKSYGGSSQDRSGSIIEVQDGFIVNGTTNSTDGDIISSNGGRDIWVLKLDTLGDIIWNNTYGGSNDDYGTKIIEADNGGYILIGNSASNNGDVGNNNGNADFWVFKINETGVIQWENNFGGSALDGANSIQEKNNGNFIVGGTSESNDGDVLANYGWKDSWIIEIDSIGNLLWNKNFGGSHQLDAFINMVLDQNENITFINSIASSDYDVSNNFGPPDFWLVKLKTLLGEINGIIYLDNNNNCINDLGDDVLSNAYIQANNLSNTYNYYNNSNNLGFYSIPIDTVNHNVSIINPSPYLETSTCSQDTHFVSISGSSPINTIDFFLNTTVFCPYMQVDISTPFLRRCSTVNYNISYCNNGTEVANGAFIEIEFDSILTINSSTIPWTSVSGSVYTFPIGNVNMFDCGTFSVSVTVPCNAFLGQILCADAHIYPDTICLSSSSWNGAELQAKAECIGLDTIEFTLKNIGSGNMSTDITAIAIEDVILTMDTLVNLNSNQEIKWKFPSNGVATHRIIAQQPSNHPYKTFTTDAVANCNLMAPPLNPNPPFLAYPNDEEAPFEAVDCQAIIGSFDPNDKTVSPTGVGVSHFITESTDLEYKIRFQNTGTDTAFLVVLTDSISNFLDIATIIPGASSHSYQYELYGSGVLKFTFNNIMLPDSFIDEPASHGFVQYKVKQKLGNNAGNVILNNADIFFDYNTPIRTNTVFSEIGGIFLDTIIYQFPKTEDPDNVSELSLLKIKTYPNPAKEFIVFEIAQSNKSISIELYNLEGKLVQKTMSINANKIQLNRNGLANGMYLFKIFTEGKELAYGKLIYK